MRNRVTSCLPAAFLAGMLAAADPATAQSTIPSNSLADYAFDQHPGAALPLDAALRDEAGRAVVLGDFFHGKPVVLAFEYFRCPGLCGLVLDRLATGLSQIPLRPGIDYQVVAISIDPKETPADAAELKARHLARGGFAGAAGGVHFLTGDAAAVRSIADRVGFPYRYDAAIAQFAHPAGVVVASPKGDVSRYLLGVDYPPVDLRLALVEASQGAIAAPATHLLLLCYGYDPAAGKYDVAVHRLLEAVGIVTMLGVGGVMLLAARIRPNRRA